MANEAWMEVDCPICDMDYDVALDERRCPGCGVIWGEGIIEGANKYAANGKLLAPANG